MVVFKWWRWTADETTSQIGVRRRRVHRERSARVGGVQVFFEIGVTVAVRVGGAVARIAGVGAVLFFPSVRQAVGVGIGRPAADVVARAKCGWQFARNLMTFFLCL